MRVKISIEQLLVLLAISLPISLPQKLYSLKEEATRISMFGWSQLYSLTLLRRLILSQRVIVLV